MLEGEELAGAAEPGLHLVDGKERAVSPAELLRAFEIAGRREVHSLSLHGLDEKERDVLGPERTFECVEVAERNPREPRQERAEALDEMRDRRPPRARRA